MFMTFDLTNFPPIHRVYDIAYRSVTAIFTKFSRRLEFTLFYVDGIELSGAV